ncbi:MAG: molybdopterin-dependent oxidoreductase [Candidatus Humimicrobiaceae bacterium]
MKIKYIVNLFILILTVMLTSYLFLGCNIRGNIIDSAETVESMEEQDVADIGSEGTTSEGVTDIGTEDGEDISDLLLKLQEKQDEIAGGAALGGGYVEVDGLHVTGNPVAVSISQYRLEVSGAVDNPLSLTFGEVKEMESVRIFISLVCPGFFTDEGYWTGVKVSKLLELAQINEDAARVRFTSLDGDYNRTLSVEKIMENEGIIIAYHFNDKEFSEIHGYPLRVAAENEPGYIWVKWLGKIEVLTEQQLEQEKSMS